MDHSIAPKQFDPQHALHRSVHSAEQNEHVLGIDALDQSEKDGSGQPKLSFDDVLKKLNDRVNQEIEAVQQKEALKTPPPPSRNLAGFANAKESRSWFGPGA
jgi:hypothetical protein